MSQLPNGILINSAVITVRPCDQHTNTQTDKQTALRATSVAISRILTDIRDKIRRDTTRYIINA